MNRRVVVTALVATVLVAATVTPAAAAVPTEVLDTAVQADAPGGQTWLVARGFAPNEPTTVAFTDPTSGAVVATAAPIVANRSGVVVSPAGYRAPTTLTPGTYTVVLSQASGATATWADPVTIDAPAIFVADGRAPGSTVTVALTGIGGATGIARTLTVDGRALDLSPVTEAPHYDVWGGVTATTVLPADLKPGTHHLVLTQASSPAATVTRDVGVAAPVLALLDHATSFPPLAGREQLTMFGESFAPGAATLSVVTADGRSYPLPAFDDSSPRRSTFTLPGLAAGNVTFRATITGNGTTTQLPARILPSTFTSPATWQGYYYDDRITSPDGRLGLDYDRSGRLVLTSGGTIVWTSPNTELTGTWVPQLAVQNDGNLVSYIPDHHAIWNSRTKTTDLPVTFSLRDDGRAVLTTAHGGVLWATPTVATTTLASGGTLGAGGRFQNERNALVVQTDGNLVLYDGPTVLFQTRTAGNTGAVLKLQGDGNLVLYSAVGRALWANRVFPGAGAKLVLQADGNLVEYSAAGAAVWSTHTAGR